MKKMNKLTIGSLALLAAAAIAAGMTAMSMGMSPGSGPDASTAATGKIAAACNTCRWYAEYDTYAQAQAAANAHLRANPGHDAGVLGR